MPLRVGAGRQRYELIGAKPGDRASVRASDSHRAAPTDGAGPDHRREWHRQGTGRPTAPRALVKREPRCTVRCGQLRSNSGRADRERVVRPREGRLHRGREPRAGGVTSNPHDGGTLMLDEIGDMDPAGVQAKLLRTLQEQDPHSRLRQFDPDRSRCASDRGNQPGPGNAMPSKQKTFRKDLFYRLHW